MMAVMDCTLSNATQKISEYALGIIKTESKKTCPQIAEELNVSHDIIFRNLKSQKELSPLIISLLLQIVKELSREKKGYLIIDDTFISKIYSQFIEGTSMGFNSLNNKCETGLSVVNLAWTNGSITIPLDFVFWLNKEVCGKDYKTKIKLAQELVEKFSQLFEFKAIILDGLYASTGMMKFLEAKNIYFIMRMPSNRVIVSNNKKRKIKEHSDLKLRRNERSRTIYTEWHGLNLYITTEKRKDKNGKNSIVFLASNLSTSSKDYVEKYRLRWSIEKFHRTSKQYLGLQDCQSRSLQVQKAHITNIFYSYAFLEYQRYQKNGPNVEFVLKGLRLLKLEEIRFSLSSFN